ncbi:hypothetical protein Q3G72_035227 [Acer saccharum]|nr:hypothetical protein Q3G72_035227 [Acer saccharum]
MLGGSFVVLELLFLHVFRQATWRTSLCRRGDSKQSKAGQRYGVSVGASCVDLSRSDYVEMGGKFFVVKIEDEQFSIEKQEELRGIIPVGRAGTLIPVEGGSVVENSEDVRRLSVDGDKATHEDSYERVGVSVSPITLKPNFENLAEMVGINNKRSGSLGENYATTDKFFEGVSGQERGKGPSKEKARDEVVIVGPMTEISSVVMGGAPVGVKEVLSGTPGLFQVEGSVPGSGSKSIRGSISVSYVGVFLAFVSWLFAAFSARFGPCCVV